MDQFIDPAMDGTTWCGILQRDADGWRAMAHGQMVDTILPTNSEEKVMLYDARVAFGDKLVLKVEDITKVVAIPEDGAMNHLLVKEACAGIGGFSQGLSQAGFKTVAFLDNNPLACSVLKMNYKVPILCGDLLCGQDRHWLHSTPEPYRCTITCGFPCQPLSVQGDRRGDQDSRSIPFRFALKAFWEQQGAALLMECVPNAYRASYVQKALQQLSWSMGMEIYQKILALDRTWVCRRTRWWMIMVPKKYHIGQIQDLPWDDSFQKVEDLMHTWTSWGEEASDLTVSAEELDMMHNPNLGSDARRLRQSGKCPCILHSYGTFHRPCPCGCRKSPFNICRLEAGGLRGFYVIDEQEGVPRFLHVKEAAMLCTISPAMKFTDGGRTCLCLVGQCAAPMQALWMGLYLQQAMLGQNLMMDVYLKTYKMKLLRDMYGVWPQENPMMISFWDAAEGQDVQIMSSRRPAVYELLLAEKRLHEGGQWMEVRDGSGRLPVDYLVGPSSILGDLRIERHQKRQKKTDKAGNCRHTILVWQDDDFDIVEVQKESGCYVFEIFAAINTWVALDGTMDAEGCVWRADDRVWTSTTFTSYSVRAYGKAMVEFRVNTWMKYGLTDVCMDAMASFLKQLSGNKVGCLSSRSSSMLMKEAVQGKCNGSMIKKLVDMLEAMFGQQW